MTNPFALFISNYFLQRTDGKCNKAIGMDLVSAHILCM